MSAANKDAERFATTHVAPTVAARDRGAVFSRELFREMAHAGLLAQTSARAEVCLQEAVARSGGDAGLGLIWASHMSCCDLLRRAAASEPRWQGVLERVASGEWIATMVGWNANIRARRHEDGWCLDGGEAHVTSAPFADVMLVIASVSQSERAAFFIEREQRGVRFAADDAKLGYRTAPSCALTFDACILPQSGLLLPHVLGEQWSGCRLWAHWLGIQRALLDRVSDALASHARLGGNTATRQGARATLADIRIRLERTRRLLYLAAQQRDAGDARAELSAATAHLALMQSSRSSAQDALELCGMDAARSGDPIERASRDALLLPLHGGGAAALRTTVAGSLLSHGSPSLLAQVPKEERAAAARLEALCANSIASRAAAVDREGALPREHFPELARAGYFALFHPIMLGGSGGSEKAIAHALESLARACAATMWSASISGVLCGKFLTELCHDAHRARWLPALIDGSRVGCFAASESGSGCDPSSYEATLTPCASGYRLKGRKMRISNATNAHVGVVVARLAGERTLAYAVVDLDLPGVAREALPHSGLRGMAWGNLVFDDVLLATNDVVVGASMSDILRCVEWGQLMQAYCGIGLASAALDACLAYCRERQAFGRAISHLQVVHARLAEMHVAIAGARALAEEACTRMARGESAGEWAMMAKIDASEMAVTMTNEAMRIFAGWGFSSLWPIERLCRDSQANVPGGLTSDRLRELIACAAVGVDPWSYPEFPWPALRSPVS